MRPVSAPEHRIFEFNFGPKFILSNLKVKIALLRENNRYMGDKFYAG